MEGFLTKRSRGAARLLPALNTWSNRWFVLEGNHLYYYENFDLRHDQAVNKRGTYPMKDTTVKNVLLPDRKYCFVIKHPTLQQLVLEAETEQLRKGMV